MKVSTPRRRGPLQPTLPGLDIPHRPLGNHGHVRTLIGNWTEDWIAAYHGGVRCEDTPLADYCPDVVVDGDVYLECKAAGRSRQTFVYEGRLQKDCRFTVDHCLFYAILHHTTDTTVHNTVEGLEQAFHRSIKSFFRVPFHDFCRIALASPLDKLNSNYGGHDKKVYGSGYRVKLSDLQPWRVM